MIIIQPSSRFKRSYQKLPKHIKNDFKKQISFFQDNPFNPKLSTHKLEGSLKSYYSFYLKEGYRVLFDFIESNNVLLVNIGSHDDYKKWEKA